MRENRLSGLEGGGAALSALPTPIQSQRDCITQPRGGAPSAYPGFASKNIANPNGVGVYALKYGYSCDLCFLLDGFVTYYSHE